MSKVLQPYKHDCPHCIWGGWIHVKGGGKFGSDWGNLYFCPNQNKDADTLKYPGSVIIRFSDEPDDYWSTPIGGLVKGGLKLS